MTVFMYILYDLSIFLSLECFIGMYFIMPDRAYNELYNGIKLLYEIKYPNSNDI